jgi:pyruvate,water dikinase|tara:strand:- start:104 stop:2479 length:2376 start_codon:yes stop_codon:yes gene_type:complete
MEFISWFKDISKDDVAKVGGKSANLGEMYNISLPVPPGFVVNAGTYKYFIEKTNIKDKIASLLSGLDVEDTKKLQETANNIQKLIIATKVPEDIKEEIIDAYDSLGAHSDEQASTTATDLLKDIDDPFVAARSSATAEDLPEASFAGQQATFLNVKGDEQLIKAVSGCWASLFTARAIYYRVKNDFEHMKVFIAVVIQKMINSEKAGVMFSINPSTNNDTEITIEAVWGLGETIVGGEVSPDLYIVDKNNLSIKDIEIKEQRKGRFRDTETGKTIMTDVPEEKIKQQILNEKEIVELAKLAKKIEQHYGKPQDMEWAIENDKLYIVQARAVTTFKPKQPEQTAEKDKIKITSQEEEKELGEAIVHGLTASPGTASGKVKIIHDMSELNKIEKGDVLVAEMTNPDMVPAMKKASAIVTEEGGMTCHAAIVSREMGIPCIVGSGNATSVLKENQIITVDATHANVYEGKIAALSEQQTSQPSQSCQPIQQSNIVTATEVKVVSDLPDYAEKAASVGADGVGLVRIEFMIAENGIHPAKYIRDNKDEEYTDMLAKGIGSIARVFNGKPVWVRTSDIRSDEYKNLEGADQEPKESDPMIGWHAIRRGLDEPRILKAEFNAIKKLHDSGVKNVGIMIPFVIRVDELRKSKEIMRQVGLEPCRDVDFGVMVETPAACWIIEDLCKEGITFISFGTNDLTQLTLGIDRNNERIAKLFDEMHPAVLGEIAKVIKVCKKNHVKTSICGQAGSRPEMAEFLVMAGIDSISANTDAVQTIRRTVAHTERKLLLDIERRRLTK